MCSFRWIATVTSGARVAGGDQPKVVANLITEAAKGAAKATPTSAFR
jgi:hypothetical protein